MCYNIFKIYFCREDFLMHKELIKYLISERESILESFDGPLSDEQ